MAGRGSIKGITVEIGGDTTKLGAALQSVNKEIKNTQIQLKDVEKLLKLDPGNTELLAQKEQLLGDAVKETKEKLEALKTAAAQANEALAKGEISQEQYDALQREIIETENDLKKLEAQAKISATALQQIATAGAKLKSAGDAVSSAGEKMLPVTATVTALGTAAVATAANFESSMSQVQATMGITKDAMSTVDGQTVNTMDTLSELAKKMGSETAFSASECAEALNYLALAGYDTQQMCDTLPTVLNLAAAGDIELAAASDMVTDAMSALGMGVDEAGTMVDQMAKTASTTNTSVSQLGEAILTIGGTAKTVKGGTAELNTALGILANNGIKGAEGGTHLRNVIMSLQTPTDKAADCIESLGLKVYDSQGNMRSMNDILGDLNTSMDGMTAAEKQNIISTIFNKTDIAAVNALLSGTGDSWNEMQSAIENSAGAAQQMADTQLDNLQGQLTILKSALEGLAISIGELVLPYIKQIVGWIQSFVDWLNSLDEGVKKVIVTVALVAAAVGPVLIVVGKVMSSVGTIMTTVPKLVSMVKTLGTGLQALWGVLAANPIALIIAAIAALVAGFIYLWNTNEEFRQFWIDLWENLKDAVTTAVEAIGTFLATAWEAIKTTAETVWNAISAFFTGLWTGIQTLFTTVVTAISTFLTTAWTTIQTTAMTIWNAISTFFSTILTAIQTVFSTVWNAISSTVVTIVNTISSTVSSVWNGILSTVSTIVTTLWNKITAVFNGIFNGIANIINNIRNTIVNGFNSAVSFITGLASQAYNWGRDIIQGIINGIKAMIGSVVSAVSDVASTIRSYLHFSVPDEGPLTDYESWMPDFMQGLAKGIESNKGLLTKAMSDVANTLNMDGVLPDMSASINANVSGRSDGTEGGNVTLNQPILLDGKTLTTVVSQIQYSQGRASLRNLGTA